MKFGYTIAYVADVNASLTFFESAFGFERRFFNEEDGSAYGELATGETVLAFASHQLAESNLPGSYRKLDGDQPVAFELAIVTEDVDAAIKQAVEAGGELLVPAKQKPWGQTVAYVRAPDGLLIEICTPISM